ncbi:uncharacterized protein [Dysidea avara]|uniref:uncharacterized protein isoform X2 n=1 Tax=Dysidea avara TaxID=196820 RepID=UPI003320BFCF
MEADPFDEDWASLSSHTSWSRDEDTLSSISLTSVRSFDLPATHSLVDGPQSSRQYNHPTIIRDVTVNHNSFYLLDDSGLVKWDYQTLRNTRVFQFPAYKHKLLKAVTYCSFYNVYFVLTMDNKVKVFNKHFSEVHCLELPAEQSKVSCIAINDRSHQLITGSLGGIKVFNYSKNVSSSRVSSYKTVEPMSQYSLVISHSSLHTEGIWIRGLSITDRLIGYSGYDVLVYSINAVLLIHLKRLHQGFVTGCVFLPSLKYFVTCSDDCTVKVWSESGSMIDCFTSHIKEVTGMLVHPHCPWLVLTTSLDGTIKQWNMATLQMEHSVTSCVGEVKMMRIVNHSCFYIVSSSSIELFEFNHFTQYWALCHSAMHQILPVIQDGRQPKILAIGVDGSVRLYSAKLDQGYHLTTVLPSHQIAPVLSVAYSPNTHTLCTLLDPNKLWVYNTRFNPAQRVTEISGSDLATLVAANNLLSSVLPTGIRLHHKKDVCSVCACGTQMLLGMMDGRVIVLVPDEDSFQTMGYLQAFISAVTLLKYDVVLNTLMCSSNQTEDVSVQLWDVTSWSLSAVVQCNSLLVDCAVLENCVMTGHDSGLVQLMRLTDSSSMDNANNNSSEVEDTRVTSVQSSHTFSLFAISHSNNVIRLWNTQCVLLLEVHLATIHSCCFLPGQACLIVDLHNHLYKVMLDKVLPQTLLMLRKECIETTSTSVTDSVIIDDLTNSPELTLQQYLAGAMVASASKTSEQRSPSSEDEVSDDESSVTSAAATNTYLSPPLSPVPSAWSFPILGQSLSDYSNTSDHPMDADSLTPSHTDTITTSGQTRADHTETETPVEVVSSEQHQWSNETSMSQEKSSPPILLDNNDLIISRPTTSKQLSTKKTAEIAWQKSHIVNKKPLKRKTQTPTVVKMSYFDSPGEVTTPVIPKHQTNYKVKKKKKKVPVAAKSSSHNNNTTLVDTSHTTVDGTHLPGSSSDGLSADDKVDISKLSLNSLPVTVSSKISAKSDVSTVRITRHVGHSNISSKHVCDNPTSSGVASSDSNDDVTTTTNNNNSVTDHTSTIVSVKSVNYDSTEISNVPHSQKVIGHSSPSSRSTRKSKSSRLANSMVHTGRGWQVDAIERARQRSSVQLKRQEDAQLHRIQREVEKRLVQSATHLKCYHQASRSSWRRPIEQATSVTSLRTSSDHDVQVEENSFHQHKLVCSNFRLNLYAHEK